MQIAAVGSRIPYVQDSFGVASSSRFFTALVIGMRIEAGEISFSTRLTDILRPELPQYADDMRCGIC